MSINFINVLIWVSQQCHKITETQREANKADFFREADEEAMPESKRKFAFDVFPKSLSLSKGFLAQWLSVSQGASIGEIWEEILEEIIQNEVSLGRSVAKIYPGPYAKCFFSSVRSCYSHPDLLLIHHHPTPPTFSDHTGPQHLTFTFWATTAI